VDVRLVRLPLDELGLLRVAATITEIRALIHATLGNEKVALIIVEGVGMGAALLDS